jgi:hypothetical protein
MEQARIEALIAVAGEMRAAMDPSVTLQKVTFNQLVLWHQAIEAALRDLPATPSAQEQWQPIETAPMDGTELLLCEFRNGEFGTIEHGSWGFIERSDWDGTAVYGWLTDSGSIEEPTHWRQALAAPVDPPDPCQALARQGEARTQEKDIR